MRLFNYSFEWTGTLSRRCQSRFSWRLDWEMRRRYLFYTKQHLLAEGFISYFINVDTFYLFLNWCSTRVSDDRKYVCGIRVSKYTKIQETRFQRNYIIARDLHGTSFQSSPKINRMLITRHISIRWKFTTPDHRSFAN